MIHVGTDTSALALYNNSTIISEGPAPNMRAALASLTGTISDTAIDQFEPAITLTGKPFTVIDFSTEVSNAAEIAETTGNVTAERIHTLFKPSYEGESFLALAPMLAHEAVRQTSSEPTRPPRLALMNLKSR